MLLSLRLFRRSPYDEFDVIVFPSTMLSVTFTKFSAVVFVIIMLLIRDMYVEFAIRNVFKLFIVLLPSVMFLELSRISIAFIPSISLLFIFAPVVDFIAIAHVAVDIKCELKTFKLVLYRYIDSCLAKRLVLFIIISVEL